MKTTIRVILFLIGISITNSISTIHHDKPKSVAILTRHNLTVPSQKIGITYALNHLNVTLDVVERKKRLLPYQNFYFNQPFNRPHQAGVSAQQYKDYENVETVNSKPEPESANLKTKDTQYHSSPNYTPFLESNALPGHFRPIMSGNGNGKSPQTEQYVYYKPQQQQETYFATKEKVSPDFSVIYEKLSQLKLRQQEMQTKTPYGYRLVPHHRFREKPQKVQEYRPTIFDSPTRYKINNPSKTTIETFTATNIDIPEQTKEEKYEYAPPRYQQISLPAKEQHPVPGHTEYRDSTKPFIHHQIAIEIPQSSLPLTFRPSIVRKPSNSKERPGKPLILIQQGKPNAKQPIFILRKQKPSVVVDENYIAEKFVSLIPSKSHQNHHRPVYVHQEYPHSPAPVYETVYDTPIQQNQQQYQPQPEYGTKLSTETHNTEYEPTAPQYYHDNGYYDYQSATATPTPLTSSSQKQTPVHIPQKTVLPQYQEKPKYEQVSQKLAPQYQEEANYEEVSQKLAPQYQEEGRYEQVSQKLVPQYQEEGGYEQMSQRLVPQYQEEAKYEEDLQESPQPSKVESSEVTSNSLSEILKQLQQSNTLPQTLTPDNIDNSIKTLVKILNALKDRQKQQRPVEVENEYEYENEAGVDLGGDVFDTPDGGTPGKPGVDYPALSTIPKTSFNCKTQRYKGFFGDPDTNCQVWHYCDLNGGQASFLCPNGTIFSQVALTCDWWYNVKCSSTAQLYVLNERLYKYIIPLSPKFPEDYSGPLVDKYLALKFQEMEEKLRKQKKGKGNSDSKEESDESESGETEDSEDESEEESRVVEETGKSTTEESSEDVESTTPLVNI